MYAHTDPVYPQPQDLEPTILNSSSFGLTWRHPNTSTYFYLNDEYFTYSVSAVVADTGTVVAQYEVDISSSDVPLEKIDFGSRVNACMTINFTVSLVRDCRVLHNTAILPRCE